MAVSKKDVEYIANLARLKFDEAELDKFTEQFNEILGYIDKLNELDTDNVEPLSHPLEIKNVLREDKPSPSLTNEEALKNAPSATYDFYSVPKVIKQQEK